MTVQFLRGRSPPTGRGPAPEARPEVPIEAPGGPGGSLDGGGGPGGPSRGQATTAGLTTRPVPRAGREVVPNLHFKLTTVEANRARGVPGSTLHWAKCRSRASCRGDVQHLHFVG